MARFKVPLVTDYINRTPVGSKAAYMENLVAEADPTGSPKAVVRPGFTHPALLNSSGTSGSGLQYQNIWMTPGNDHLRAVSFNPANNRTELLLYTAVADPSVVAPSSVTMWAGSTFQNPRYINADIVAIAGSANDVGYFVKLDVISVPGDPTFNSAAITYSAYSTLTGAVTDSDYPLLDTGPGVAFLRGYVFVWSKRDSLTPRIHNSGLYDASSWDALGYIIPDTEAGAGIGLTSYKDHIVFFSTNNITFYYISPAATGSPLVPRKDLIYDVGALANRSKTTVVATDFHLAHRTWWRSDNGEVLAVAGSSAGGAKGVYLFEGFSLVKISTPSIERAMVGASRIYLSGLQMNGRVFLTLHLSGTTYLYDPDSKLWTKISSNLVSLASDLKLRHSTGDVGLQQGGVFLTNVDGNCESTQQYKGRIHAVKYPADAYDFPGSGAAVPIVATTQLARWRGEAGHSSRRKRISEVSLVADTLTSGSCNLTWSDDDYGTFSSSRAIPLTSPLKRLTRMGETRERVWKVTFTTGSEHARFEALEGEYEVGSN